MKKRNKRNTLVTTMVVFLLTIILLATGCNATDDKPVENGGEPVEKVSFEDRELVVATSGDPTTYNPYNNYARDQIHQVYESLVIVNEDREVVPHIAESIDVSPDGLTYLFKIKNDVQFSDGTVVKASDVMFSFEKMATSPYTSYTVQEYESCSVVDEYSVQVVLKKPSVTFLEKISTFLFIVSEGAYEQFGEQYGESPETVIGTGPYILKEWKSGELSVFEANPNYFRGEADIKKVRYKTITDTNAAVIALQTHEVDMYGLSVPGLSINAIEADDELYLVKFPSKTLYFAFMNSESGPFADIRLRQAVAYAVDRNKALIVGTEGEGTLVDSPGGWDYTGNPGEQTWHYEQDLEKAKSLVKEAGMEGASITLKLFTLDPFPKIATSIQSDLNQIGLNVEVLQLEVNTYIEEVLSNGDYGISICQWGSGTKDMDEVIGGHLGSENIGLSGNWSRFSNPDVDALIEKARSTFDVEERKELYADIIQIYTDEVVEIPLCYPLQNRAFTNDLNVDIDLIEFARVYDFKWND